MTEADVQLTPPLQAKQLLERAGSLNPPIAATPPPVPSDQSEFLPPMITCSVTPCVRLPGSTVVTFTLNGEYFSAMCFQMLPIVANSCALKLAASVSIVKAGMGVLVAPAPCAV